LGTRKPKLLLAVIIFAIVSLFYCITITGIACIMVYISNHVVHAIENHHTTNPSPNDGEGQLDGFVTDSFKAFIWTICRGVGD
ncbi:hypothetical protein PMAYCL1PPCAC_25106, partial [Pristionchus mayeri]